VFGTLLKIRTNRSENRTVMSSLFVTLSSRVGVREAQLGWDVFPFSEQQRSVTVALIVVSSNRGPRADHFVDFPQRARH